MATQLHQIWSHWGQSCISKQITYYVVHNRSCRKPFWFEYNDDVLNNIFELRTEFFLIISTLHFLSRCMKRKNLTSVILLSLSLSLSLSCTHTTVSIFSVCNRRKRFFTSKHRRSIFNGEANCQKYPLDTNDFNQRSIL